MATVAKSFSVEGIDGFPIEIEACLISGMPTMSIIGLGDQAVQEAGDRIRAAVVNSGYKVPAAKIILSLAPGDQKKSGSHYDLGMAIALLKESGQIKGEKLSEFGIIGELSLTGKLRPSNGILPMVINAKETGVRKIIVPIENANEARLISGIEIFGLSNLKEVVAVVNGKMVDIPKVERSPESNCKKYQIDFSEVRGQDSLIEAVALGVAGGHNILMIGEPGCGKTMIAERIPTIMPKMLESEALDVTRIQSVTGLLPPNHALVTERPFRAPHHNASLNALIGGGNPAKPGEVSLAHNGVLFFDELPEFQRMALEALRQPMENKEVTIARVNGTHTYPANFMFVAAMNPCPCGYYPSKKCRCSDYEIRQYRSKISGPILDRIDIQKSVKPVNYFDVLKYSPKYTSEYLRNYIFEAREIQVKRFNDYENINCNAQMSASLIREFCVLDAESEELLKTASKRNGYSARVINKMLRVARTAADLRHSDSIEKIDIEFVLKCRDLDCDNARLYTV